jgi:hypothetical protein
MKKGIEFIDVWGNKIILLLVIIVFLKTCNTNYKIEKVSKKIGENYDEIIIILDDIKDKDFIEKEEMIILLKTTPNWKTLELEELSDKNKIPINKLKNDGEK